MLSESIRERGIAEDIRPNVIQSQEEEESAFVPRNGAEGMRETTELGEGGKMVDREIGMFMLAF